MARETAANAARAVARAAAAPPFISESDKKEWLSGEMFERRIRFADAIYTAGRPKFKSDDIMNRINANDTTRNLVASVGMSEKTKFIALMCSPEIMGLENA